MQDLQKKIADLQQKQQQLKAQEKALKARQSEQERKARTRRLIQAGAAIESVIGQPAEGDALEEVLEILRQVDMDADEQILKMIGGVVQEVASRTLSADDIHKIRRFLEAQETRGQYLTRALQ